MSNFQKRHIGSNQNEENKLLETIGYSNTDQLINQTIPDTIRLEKELNIPEALSEATYLNTLKETLSENKVMKSYIGLGYNNTHTPSPIQRHVLENPAWYTAYTPYQAEISQGRLEALLNFQTMVSELTKMDIATASLLDEGTAAAEAITLLHRSRARHKKKANKILVSQQCFPQTLDIIKSRTEPLGLKASIQDPSEFNLEDETVFAILLQYPNENGSLEDYKELAARCHENDILVAVGTDELYQGLFD